MGNASIECDNSRKIFEEIQGRRWYNVYRALKKGFDVNADIEPDIDLNIIDNYGQTVVHYVIRNKSSLFLNSGEQKIELIKLFLKTGLNINTQNDIGRPIIHEAVKSGNEKLVKFLLNYGADMNAVDKFGQTALHIALDKFQEPIVDMFLNYKFDVNSQNKEGESLLFSACRARHEKAVKKLLELKVFRVNQIKNGKTVLHILCSYSQSDLTARLVKYLLDYKADIDCVDEYGCTPLHYACQSCNEKVVKLLLKHRAKVNHEDKERATPLHYAIVKKQLNIVQLLLEYGANVNKCYKTHSSPLFLAVNLTDLHSNFSFGYNSKDTVEIIDSLLKYGADINIQDWCGNTVVHVACKSRKDVLGILLSYNPDFNIADESGLTPLRLLADQLEYFHLYDSQYNQYSAMFSKLLTYIISMQAANAHVSQQNLLIMKQEDIRKWCPDKSLEDWNALYDRCKKLLIGLKKRFPGTIISYYDILIKDVKEIAMYVNDNNGEFPKHLENFEHYRNIIEAKINQAFARRNLLNKISTVFNFLFTDSPCLPQLCIEEICSYLSNCDLRSVLIVFNDITGIVDLKMNDGTKNIFYNILNNEIRGIKIRNLPEKHFKIFHPIFANLPKLPSNCMKNICCNLSDNDIRNLLNICQASSIHSICTEVQEDAGKFYSKSSKKLRLM
ncbi:ankyrin-3-like [Uloborus diversus]|uniref:ankyrin-3-like n=1 Tax=Uloborus diversus TaxID=327109 RepID=UPI00240A7BDB|nr:ankyrin-3-like [Uloborus diversus]